MEGKKEISNTTYKLTGYRKDNSTVLAINDIQTKKNADMLHTEYKLKMPHITFIITDSEGKVCL